MAGDGSSGLPEERLAYGALSSRISHILPAHQFELSSCHYIRDLISHPKVPHPEWGDDAILHSRTAADGRTRRRIRSCVAHGQFVELSVSCRMRHYFRVWLSGPGSLDDSWLPSRFPLDVVGGGGYCGRFRRLQAWHQAFFSSILTNSQVLRCGIRTHRSGLFWLPLSMDNSFWPCLQNPCIITDCAPFIAWLCKRITPNHARRPDHDFPSNSRSAKCRLHSATAGGASHGEFAAKGHGAITLAIGPICQARYRPPPKFSRILLGTLSSCQAPRPQDGNVSSLVCLEEDCPETHLVCTGTLACLNPNCVPVWLCCSTA